MTESKFDRIADAFLAPGPTVLPDRVLDAAFEEVHRTRRRRVLRRVPWRFPDMNTFAKVAVAAVAVIAVGFLGMTFLGPDESGIGGAPSAAPSATTAPTATPSASPLAGTPPLTGAFTSPSHGYAIAYPESWKARPATAPWSSNIVDYFNEGSDILAPADPGSPFIALASQPLGDRTREQFEADYWQIMVDDDPGAAACASEAEPITIDGAAGVMACDAALVTDGGRGYVAMLWSSDGAPYDDAWFASVLATMKLNPEDAVDAAGSAAPPLTGRFTSSSHGYSISYPEGWDTRPATAPWTTGVVDYFNEGADLLMPGDPGNPFLALASQPLGDRTREEWEADVWQILIDDDPGTAACQSAAEPITIDGAPGVRGCDNVLVTDGGRGYLVMLWVSGDGPAPGEYDQAWYESVLATMKLRPEDAADPGA
jgi:hypothetical protein